MISIKKILSLLIVCDVLFFNVSWAESNDNLKFDDLKGNNSVKERFAEGYNNSSILKIANWNYLILTNKDGLNNCAAIFKIGHENIPEIASDNEICNLKTSNGKVISSWREAGKWNEAVYSINEKGNFILMLTDTCIDCGEVKRTYAGYNPDATQLLTDGENYTKRKPLHGVISKDKALVYKSPDITRVPKNYLIAGDKVLLLNRTDDGELYKIKYINDSGKSSLWWIKQADFEIE